ncbi:MAG TPA: cupin domain-containing protein [Caulobacteraceae bacterium]|nr:cupin domain-containing protein [Caulobacteraceae bacterium]
MSLDTQPVINVADISLNALAHGERFAVQTGEIAEALGLATLGCMLHVVPPGKTAFPFHRHHGCDEMFVILSGSGVYRIGEARLSVRPGDCLEAPAGGEAHQIINTGGEELRYLGLSNVPPADLVEYPDSGKIGVGVGAKGTHPENATFKKRGRLTPAEYWDGED